MSSENPARFEVRGTYVWVDANLLYEQGDACLTPIEEAAILSNPSPQVAVDFDSIEYINSILLSLLIRMKKRIEDKNGTICLVNISDYCEDLISKLRLNTVFTLYKTIKHFDDFQSSVHNQGMGNHIVLNGNITVSTADELRVPVKKLIDDGATDIVIDMTKVSIIDSIGVGELIRYSKVLKNKGGSLRLINVGKDIHEFLTLLRLDKHIQMERQ